MTVKPTKKNRHSYTFTALAIVPVYCTFYFYTHSVMDRSDDEEMATFMTAYFIACLYTGRYLSSIVNNGKTVSQKTFTITGGAIVVSAALFLILTQATIGFNLNYLRILVVAGPFTIFSLSLGAMIKFARTHMQYQLQEANAVAEQNRSELKFLQNQLSPHFLFNTLNNIYGISLTQHQKVPPLLLKLSELLRYSVYEAKELFVPLKDELAYINNYIAFEQIRIGDRLRLTATFDPVNSEEIRIAPMLLITFIENAFKHSKNTSDKTISVDIILQNRSDRILFSIKNSYTQGNEPSYLDKNSGLGLANAKKRLELLYPGEHELNVDAQDDVFSVLLQLKTK